MTRWLVVRGTTAGGDIRHDNGDVNASRPHSIQLNLAEDRRGFE